MTSTQLQLRPPYQAQLPDGGKFLIELDEPLRRLLLDPARSIGRDDIEVVGVTEIPRHPIVRQTERGTWFFAADYLDDPGLSLDGGIAIPKYELQRLHALRDAGLQPDLVWIAHEVPETWSPDQPLPELVPDAPHMRVLDAGLERFVRGTTRASVQVIRGVGIGLGLGIGLALAPIAVVGLDPVILAGVRHPERPVVAWVKIAEWRWA